jgi:hypothetical protein
MCGCGRKRADQVTSVQAAQDAEAARASLARAEADAVREAETYVQSAIAAAENSRYR